MCIYIYMSICIYIYIPRHSATLLFWGLFKTGCFLGSFHLFWGRLSKKGPFPLAMLICSLNPAGPKSHQKP